ncbi:MAG: hypothetical protein HKN74_00680 [Acidimicrobiia bacterium]|nr:hypothetical protein [Acidimicrobiia bacterium]
MLTRIWRTRFDPDRLGELQEFADTVSGPMFRRLPGCRGYIYAVAGSTWVTQTFWDSQKEIAAAEASGDYRQVVAALEATGILRDEPTTEILTVTGTEMGW